MAEILPNGTLQGYSNICPECKKTIQVNMQGTPINHKCEVKNLDIPHVIKSVCPKCGSDRWIKEGEYCEITADAPTWRRHIHDN